MKDTVLIVDDSTFIVEGLVALLKKTYQPIPSYGGEECLAILRTIKPSIIILDIMMEPMDGWETLARIKENPQTRHIPVLMFSAKKISPEEAEAHRIIIDDFLTKPVNPKKLLEAIEKVLARQAFNRQILLTWTAACVSPEIIDEYLTLKTNLDVDVSLLAVMKKQLDIAYPDAVNREDLVRSIAALEERIGVSRARIETFCQEQAGLLPVLEKAGAGLLSPDSEPEVVPVILSPEPEIAPVSPAAEPATPPDVPKPPAENLPPVPEPGSSPEPVREETPEPALISPVMAEKLLPDEGEQPEAHQFPPVISSPVPLSPVRPDPGLPQVIAAQPVALDPVFLEPAPDLQENTAIPPPLGDEGAALLVPNPLFAPFEEPAEPVHLPKNSEPGTSEASHRTTLPSRSRLERDESPAYPPGAGTMTPRMRSGETTRLEMRREQDANVEQRSQEPASSGSIFSRIIAAVAALFGKKAR